MRPTLKELLEEHGDDGYLSSQEEHIVLIQACLDYISDCEALNDISLLQYNAFYWYLKNLDITQQPNNKTVRLAQAVLSYYD